MQSTIRSMNDPLDDDQPVGRVLSRREILALFGTVGTASVVAACVPGATSSALPSVVPTAAASAAPSSTSSPSAAAPSGGVAVPACVVTPELTEGPYFVDAKLDRADIRTDTSDGIARDGLPLQLTFAVARIDGTTCVPFEGALVDVWHCDAAGAYSGVADPGFDTSDQDWLRGYQVTNADGQAVFTTIYPGWYSGRAVHIHFKIRDDPDAAQGLEFTSQLFFDETVTATAYQVEPYASKGPADVPNESDGIYNQSGGQLTLVPTGDTTNGYAATLAVGVQVA
jgi:protocatechuate 3,4-dioxygenase beta subunit